MKVKNLISEKLYIYAHVQRLKTRILTYVCLTLNTEVLTFSPKFIVSTRAVRRLPV